MFSEDREYVKRVLAGDSAAFEGLVHQYSRLGGAIAFAVLGDFGLAEDVVQEAFLKAYGALKTLREPEQFRLWFSGIVRRQAIDTLRRRKRHGANELQLMESAASVANEPDERFLREERRRKVVEAMAGLSRDDRLVIVLKHLEGLSYREISEVTNASLSAVESRLFRARRTLKEKLVNTIGSDL